MVIIEDTRQKPSKNADIREQIEAIGYEVRRFSLPCGDYQIMGRGNVSVDTKQDLQELYANIIHDNARFRRECELARSGGVRLVVLITDPCVRSLDEVPRWKNPRRDRWFYVHAAHKRGKMLGVKIASQPPVSSEQLMRAMRTMTERYSVEWRFCDRMDAGKQIVDLLSGVC